MLGALDTEQTLLALKIGFLVLLYLFIWMVVRSVTRDLRSAPQESIILNAQEANELLWLARSLGTTPSALREDYRRATRRSRRVVERLFYAKT